MPFPLENRTLWDLFPLGKGSEKKCMGHLHDFAATLEKKLRRSIEAQILEENPGFTRPLEKTGTDVLPVGFAWILGQKDHLTQQIVNERQAHKAYGVRPRPPTPHVLNELQRQAFERFQSADAALDPWFRLTELKAAWRKIAKRTHPDHGGDAARFRQMRAAYQVLLTIFRT